MNELKDGGVCKGIKRGQKKKYHEKRSSVEEVAQHDCQNDSSNLNAALHQIFNVRIPQEDK